MGDFVTSFLSNTTANSTTFTSFTPQNQTNSISRLHLDNHIIIDELPIQDQLITMAINQETTHNNEFDHQEIHHHEVIILAPFFLLGLGALLKHTTKSLPIPYTMQLLVVGTVLGSLLRRDDWDDTLQKSIAMLGDMDPHLMLHIFLPPLIFESAASLEWHLFTKAKSYILSLAGPGLLLGAGLTGVILKALFDRSDQFQSDLIASNCPEESWSFPAALMLGVIMSATDPVAVVALLKDLGCKASLSTSIEGESLFNDGTALVMFTILVKIVEGDNSDGIDEYLWTFVKMSFGGGLFGVTFAVFIVHWLRMIFNDALAEITITLSAAYLCFFIAEYFFHVSGVISVVCLGLYFGHNGRTSVSPEVAHFLEEFWEMLAFFGNTLIFVVAGIVIGYKLPIFSWKAFGELLFMYMMCTIIRGIVVGLNYGLFRAFRINLDKKDQIMTIWGGLRGAVGLSLAMMVFGNQHICEPVRDIVMLHTAGIVVLTVCINATLMPKLVHLLGLDSIPPSKQLIYNQAMNNLMLAGKKQESNLRADHIFDSTVWDKARKYYFNIASNNIIEREALMSINEHNDRLAEKEARRRVLMITKKSYWRQFKDGLLSHHSVKYLVHHSDMAIDNDCSLNEWETYVQLVRLYSAIDKGTEKLVAAEGSSETEKKKLKLLNYLDSIPAILFILALVFTSCTLAFVLDMDSSFYMIFQHSTTIIFFAEFCARLYCLQDWHPFAVDPYIAFDGIALFLDVLLLSATDFLGKYGEFSKSIRTIRFIRLIRLLRLARIANRLKRVKIGALGDEPKSLWEETDTCASRYRRRILFSQLKHGYEVATGFRVAREEVIQTIRHIHSSNDHHLNEIIQAVEQDLKDVRSALLDMQRLYSEIAASITTAVAARTVLNRQRHAMYDLYHEGLLDLNEYKKMKGSVEYQMKTLTYYPPIIRLSDKKDLLGQIPWLECLKEKEFLAITDSFEEHVFQRGDVLLQQNEDSDSVHVLARGTVLVAYENQAGEQVDIDELGIGSVFGEIAWALKSRRGASIIATSPGLVFKISGLSLRRHADSNTILETRLWYTCGRRLSENLMAMTTEKSRREIREDVHEMHLYTVDPMNKNVFFNGMGFVILLKGIAILQNDFGSTVVESPQVLRTKKSPLRVCTVEFSTDAKYMCHPKSITSYSEFASQTESVENINLPSFILDLEMKKSGTFSAKCPSINDFARRTTRISKLEENDNDRRYTVDVGNATLEVERTLQNMNDDKTIEGSMEDNTNVSTHIQGDDDPGSRERIKTEQESMV